MMNRAILLLACLLTMSVADAQKIITIKGTITDSKTKEALPGVTVYVQGGFCTQSNGDGLYIIKIPQEKRNDNIIYSVFGYDRDTITVKEALKHPNVKLNAGGAIKLSEVTISEYKPQTLIQEAVKRIPTNFWTDSVVGTFFYRDCRQLNGEIYLFDEMVFDALRVGYDKHNTIKKTNNDWRHEGERAIESNYKAILFSRLLVNDTAYINQITNGTGDSYLNYNDNEVLYDPVEIPNTTQFFSSSKRLQKIWEYDMQEYTDAEGIVHYVVTLTNDAHLYGTSSSTVRITITKGSFAITKVERIHNTKLNKIGWPLNKIFEKANIDSIYWNNTSTFNYSEVEGKMTLTSFSHHKTTNYFYAPGSNYGDGEQQFDLSCQGVLTTQRAGDASFLDSNNIQSPVRIAVSERQQGELRYDEAFWNQYNFVPLEDELLKKLNARLEKK